jgi:hypothetical protein
LEKHFSKKRIKKKLVLLPRPPEKNYEAGTIFSSVYGFRFLMSVKRLQKKHGFRLAVFFLKLFFLKSIPFFIKLIWKKVVPKNIPRQILFLQIDLQKTICLRIFIGNLFFSKLICKKQKFT